MLDETQLIELVDSAIDWVNVVEHVAEQVSVELEGTQRLLRNLAAVRRTLERLEGGHGPRTPTRDSQ